MSNRRRGREAENELAALIGGVRISRTGEEGPDVMGPSGVIIEVKRIKKLPALLRDWLGQAEREAAELVTFRANHGQWHVLCTLAEYRKLGGRL